MSVSSVSYNTENWESAPCTRFKVIFYFFVYQHSFPSKGIKQLSVGDIKPNNVL